MLMRNLGPYRFIRICGVGWGSSQPRVVSSAREALTVRRSVPNTSEIHDALHVPPATQRLAR